MLNAATPRSSALIALQLLQSAPGRPDPQGVKLGVFKSPAASETADSAAYHDNLANAIRLN